MALDVIRVIKALSSVIQSTYANITFTQGDSGGPMTSQAQAGGEMTASCTEYVISGPGLDFSMFSPVQEVTASSGSRLGETAVPWRTPMGSTRGEGDTAT